MKAKTFMCKKCGSRSIRLKRNYTHGKKSTPLISKMCKSCGSVNIEEERKWGKRRF